MKIKVKPEGRENIWLPEKESLKAYIKSRNLDKIHNCPAGSFMIMADHPVESVLREIDNNEKVAVFTDINMNMSHSLAIIKNNKLEMYDIGELTLNDIEIIE